MSPIGKGVRLEIRREKSGRGGNCNHSAWNSSWLGKGEERQTAQADEEKFRNGWYLGGSGYGITGRPPGRSIGMVAGDGFSPNSGWRLKPLFDQKKEPGYLIQALKENSLQERTG